MSRTSCSNGPNKAFGEQRTEQPPLIGAVRSERFVLELEALTAGKWGERSLPIIRLRIALKYLWRSLGIKCVRMERIPAAVEAAPDSPSPRSKSGVSDRASGGRQS